MVAPAGRRLKSGDHTPARALFNMPGAFLVSALSFVDWVSNCCCQGSALRNANSSRGAMFIYPGTIKFPAVTSARFNPASCTGVIVQEIVMAGACRKSMGLSINLLLV
ncbi:MAG: hypothetical protein OIF57_09920 [Marinobacterium sp.]|nr:hypothetical protein [Marinobacterium sp.]